MVLLIFMILADDLALNRWHFTPNHHRLWKLNTGLQATWTMSFSTLPPDSRTLVSKLNTKLSLIWKEDFGPLATVQFFCSSIPATLDPLQFANRPNRSTDDAISQVLHSSLTHIDSKNGNYVRLLFIDYSSAFNTIVPTKLAVKLSDLDLNTSLCDWIQDFLTARPQVVKVGQFTSNSITLNVGAPQGCVLSPLLYSLYTHDCVSSHSSTSIVKFADDTVVLGLVSNNDEAAYLHEVERLTSWCQDNCLSLNVSKTKEHDCRLQEETAVALHPFYDQWDPCGEGEQLRVPRCKHLRGPDLDCTHSNTGQESQAKTVPSATAEEIQGLTSYPENFLFRGHR